MEVRNSSFAAYIDVFTSNTYAMVVMSDVGVCKYPLSSDCLVWETRYVLYEETHVSPVQWVKAHAQ